MGLKGKFKNVYKKYETQHKKDTYNCRIYLLYYVDQFLDEKKGKFKPQDYRVSLQYSVLKESENMQKVCRRCFKDAESIN